MGNLNFRPETFLYCLQHQPEAMWVGRTRAGEQFLALGYWEGMLGLFFDSQGRLLRAEQQGLPPPTGYPEQQPSVAEREEYERRVKELFDTWLLELGFEAGPIHVRRFRLEQPMHVEICDRPLFHAEFLDGVAAYWDEEEKPFIRQEIDSWEAEGKFVFIWGNDWYVDGDGWIEST